MASIEGPRGKKGSYLISIYAGRDALGKRIRKSFTYTPDSYTAKGNLRSEAAKRHDAELYALQLEKKELSGAVYSDEKLTVRNLADIYLEQAKLSQTPSAYRASNAACERFKHDFGHIRLKDLSAAYLQDYVNKMLQTKSKRGTVVSQSTVKRRMNVMSAMLSEAVRLGLISSNPMRSVSVKKADLVSPPTGVWSTEQSIRFLQALNDPMLYDYEGTERTSKSGTKHYVSAYTAKHYLGTKYKLFFSIALYEGARRGEILALTWDDIDFEKKTITINKSVSIISGRRYLKSTKTPASKRTIAVAESVLEVARIWKEEQEEYRQLMGTAWKAPGDFYKSMDQIWREDELEDNFIFTREDGELLDIDSPGKAFKRLIANYNKRVDEPLRLPIIRLHDLRVTSCSLLIAAGMDMKTVSSRLGHGKVSTTMDMYARTMSEKDVEAAEIMDNLLKS